MERMCEVMLAALRAQQRQPQQQRAPGPQRAGEKKFRASGARQLETNGRAADPDDASEACFSAADAADTSVLSSCAAWLATSKDMWAQQAQLGVDPADAMQHLLDWMDAVVSVVLARLHTPGGHSAGRRKPDSGTTNSSAVGTRAVVLAVIQFFEEDTALSAVVSLVNHALSSFAPPLIGTSQNSGPVRMTMPSGSWPSIWGRLPSLTQRVLCICCTRNLFAVICNAPVEWTTHAAQVFLIVVSYRGTADPALASALGHLLALASSAQDTLAIAHQLLSHSMHALVLLGLQRAYTHEPQQAARVLACVLPDVPFPAAGLVLSNGRWNSAAGSPCDWALLLQLVLHDPMSAGSQEVSPALRSIVRAALAALTNTLIASRSSKVLRSGGGDGFDTAAASLRDSQKPCGALFSTWPWYRVLLHQWLASEAAALLANCQLDVAPPISTGTGSATTATTTAFSFASTHSSSDDPSLTQLLVALCCACEIEDLHGLTAAMGDRVADLHVRSPAQVKVLVWLLARVFQQCPTVGSTLAVDVLDTLLHAEGGLPAALAWSNELWNMSSFFSNDSCAVSVAGRSHPRIALNHMARRSVALPHHQNSVHTAKGEENQQQQTQQQPPEASLAMAWAMLWAMDVERGGVSRPCVPQVSSPILQLLEECLLSHQSTLSPEDFSSARSIFVTCLKRHSAAAACSLVHMIRTCCAHQPLTSETRSAPDSQPQDRDVDLFRAIANPRSGRVFKHKKHHHQHHGGDSQQLAQQGITVKRWEGWASSIACSLTDSLARTLLINALQASMSVPTPQQTPPIPFNCTTVPSLPSFDRELDQLIGRCPVVLDILSECIKTPEEFEVASPFLSSMLRSQHSKLIRLQKASKPCPPTLNHVLTVVSNIMRALGKLDEEFSRISLVWHRIRPAHLANILGLLYSRLFACTAPKAEQATALLLKPFISDLDQLGVFLPDTLRFS